MLKSYSLSKFIEFSNIHQFLLSYGPILPRPVIYFRKPVSFCVSCVCTSVLTSSHMISGLQTQYSVSLVAAASTTTPCHNDNYKNGDYILFYGFVSGFIIVHAINGWVFIKISDIWRSVIATSSSAGGGPCRRTPMSTSPSPGSAPGLPSPTIHGPRISPLRGPGSLIHLILTLRGPRISPLRGPGSLIDLIAIRISRYNRAFSNNRYIKVLGICRYIKVYGDIATSRIAQLRNKYDMEIIWVSKALLCQAQPDSIYLLIFACSDLSNCDWMSIKP